MPEPLNNAWPAIEKFFGLEGRFITRLDLHVTPQNGALLTVVELIIEKDAKLVERKFDLSQAMISSTELPEKTSGLAELKFGLQNPPVPSNQGPF